MKRNTGCGCGGNDHKSCPPLPGCDVAKSNSFKCETDTFLVGALDLDVVLADVFVETIVEADIHLPTPARDIKHIRKNVHLTQCKATPDFADRFRVKLFVEGFVHKNIQYVEGCRGDVKDFSVNVPFRCFDFVTLEQPVVFPIPFGNPFSLKSNQGLEIRELAADGMGADRCNFGSITFENNNEPIKCKLLSSAVDQWDITSDFNNFGNFSKITEKMSIALILKLSQKQQHGTPGGLTETSISQEQEAKNKNVLSRLNGLMNRN